MQRAFCATVARSWMPNKARKALALRTLASPCSCRVRTFSTSDPNKDKTKPRPDPSARRPNQKCDPYGQGGKPLTAAEAERLLATVHSDWKLQGEHEQETKSPTHLTRSFHHHDFLSGSSFLHHLAAVAQMNDHYPELRLERQLDSRRKQWIVVSTVRCHTFVLQGLSHHDFYVATVSKDGWLLGTLVGLQDCLNDYSLTVNSLFSLYFLG